MKKLLLLSAFIIFACSSKSIDGDLEKDYIKYDKNIVYFRGLPYSGEKFANYKNGKLKYKESFKESYKDGKRDGLNERFYKNGLLKEKGNFKDGNRDGLLEWYSESGQLIRKANFKDDKKID